MTISEYEDAIKRFLRKISPDSDWQYIGEVEHVWMAELYDKLAAESKEENAELLEESAQLKERNEKLVTLVSHLMYVKPRDVIGIRHEGEVLHFDKLLEEVGLRWEDSQ